MKKASVSLFLRKDAIKKDGKAPIYFLVCGEKSKTKKIHSNKFIPPKYWDDKAKKVKKVRGEGSVAETHYRNIDSFLQSNLLRLQGIIMEFEQTGKDFTFEQIKERFEGKEESVDLIQFIEKELRTNRKQKGEGTITGYKSLLRNLQTFKSNIPIKQVDYNFLLEYQNFLHSIPTINNVGTIRRNLSFLKTYINEAENQDLIEIQNNPFRKFKMPRVPPTIKDFLTVDEVKKLFNLLKEETLNPHLQNALHLFLIACFTGLRYSDWKKVKEGLRLEDNQIRIHQEKTDIPIIIPLNKPLKFLLTWNYDKVHNISDQKARDYIKLIVKQIGIDKKVGTHTGRHTFVIMAINVFKIPIYEVSTMVGHQSVKTTQNYYAQLLLTEKEIAMKKYDTVFSEFDF